MTTTAAVELFVDVKSPRTSSTSAAADGARPSTRADGAKKLSEVYDGPSSGRASTSSSGSPAPVRRGPSRGPSFAVTTFGAALDAAGLGR